jgi:hypothetical protein
MNPLLGGFKKKHRATIAAWRNKMKISARG